MFFGGVPLRRIITGLTLLLVSGLLAVIAISLILLRLQGWQYLSVQTGSMAPLFDAGDGVLVRPAQPSELQVGDIVSFRSTQQIIFSHRIVAIDAAKRTMTTRGDRNRQPDGVIGFGNIIGKTALVLPRFGTVVRLSHYPGALFLLVYLPGCLVIAAELQRLRNHWQRSYRLAGYTPRQSS